MGWEITSLGRRDPYYSIREVFTSAVTREGERDGVVKGEEMEGSVQVQEQGFKVLLCLCESNFYKISGAIGTMIISQSELNSTFPHRGATTNGTV